MVDDVPSKVLVMDALPVNLVPSVYFVNLVVVAVIFITELIADEDAVVTKCDAALKIVVERASLDDVFSKVPVMFPLSAIVVPSV